MLSNMRPKYYNFKLSSSSERFLLIRCIYLVMGLISERGKKRKLQGNQSSSKSGHVISRKLNSYQSYDTQLQSLSNCQLYNSGYKEFSKSEVGYRTKADTCTLKWERPLQKPEQLSPDDPEECKTLKSFRNYVAHRNIEKSLSPKASRVCNKISPSLFQLQLQPRIQRAAPLNTFRPRRVLQNHCSNFKVFQAKSNTKNDKHDLSNQFDKVYLSYRALYPRTKMMDSNSTGISKIMSIEEVSQSCSIIYIDTACEPIFLNKIYKEKVKLVPGDFLQLSLINISQSIWSFNWRKV